MLFIINPYIIYIRSNIIKTFLKWLIIYIILILISCSIELYNPFQENENTLEKSNNSSGNHNDGSSISSNPIIKIAYVTDNTSGTYVNDTIILPGLQADSNFEVTEIQATFPGILPACNANDVVIISEMTNTFIASFQECEGINKPVLFMETSGYKNTNFGWDWADFGFGDNNIRTTITATDTSHPIFTGITFTGPGNDEVQILTAVSSFSGLSYSNPSVFKLTSGSIDSIANVKTEAVQICILEITPGTVINGTTVPQKFLQIGIHGNSYSNVTNDGLNIIKNSVYYLMGRL